MLGDDWAGVHSTLEYRYVHRVEIPHGLPRGRRQARVMCGSSVRYRDVLYEAFRLIVELDGRAAHPGDTRWNDIRRDNSAAADGQVTLRYGWDDVTRQPCLVAAQVAATLRLAAPPGVRLRPHHAPRAARCGPIRRLSGHDEEKVATGAPNSSC